KSFAFRRSNTMTIQSQCYRFSRRFSHLQLRARGKQLAVEQWEGFLLTTRQLLLMICFYLVLLGAAVHFTRATTRRIAGALVGGAIIGLVQVGMITFGETPGGWGVPIRWTPDFLSPMFILSAVAGAFVLLLTWRIARRFGWRGL